MTFSVLSIYRLFFITKDDVLYALTRDGRVLKVKETPYFPALSCDGTTLAGIFFDGKDTHIEIQSFGFNSESRTHLTSLFGYCYYPTLNASQKQMAVIEVDLLKPRTQGELCIYKKKISKWYLMERLDAKMRPPVFLKDDSVLFIDSQNCLTIHASSGQCQTVAQNVQCFGISPDNSWIALFDGTQICLYSMEQKRVIQNIIASYVTCVTFNSSAQEIIYATSYENRHAIYAFGLKSGKTALLTQTQEPVTLLGF